uniref:Reverse transcriptase domain-containing protein n=1 Tax=Amphimedon queenslandica TaxID=400682 RepID=A0A1X7TNB5_AMPQE
MNRIAELSNLLQQQIAQARADYEAKLLSGPNLQAISSPAMRYLKTLHPLSPTNILDSISISDTEVYEALSILDPKKAKGIDGIVPLILRASSLSLYSPIHHLLSQSLVTSSLLLKWLMHLISSIHKAGDKSDVSNYRPISLFGFLANRSVLHQLLTFLTSIMETFHANSSTDVTYLDIRKAFDSISHSILLSKLSSVGFSGRLLEWFKCYLTSWQQCVVVHGTKFSMLPVLSGVPQGSILGPLLFILYIDDLPSALHKALPLMFADDTKCFAPVVSPGDCLSLQDDHNSLVIWSEQAKLLFNHTKCSFMRFSSSSSLLPPPSYTINGIDIPNKNLVRDLGI